MTTVVDVRESPAGGYEVETVHSGWWVRKQRQTWRADQVVFSAAALGTQNLLHRLRANGSLPRISPRLGELARTNSEANLIATSRTRTDLAQVWPGRRRSTPMRTPTSKPSASARAATGRSYSLRPWSTAIGTVSPHGPWRICVIRPHSRAPSMFGRRRRGPLNLLVMQDLNNSLTTYLKRGLFGATMTTRQGGGEPNPNWIPVANDITRRAAAKIDGDPRGSYFDLVNRPLTAHFIGGCPIGDSPATGVVDSYQRLYGYPGLHVIDGSTITANLGVNPALTITAQSERAVALWPNKGEPDPRPPLGSSYQRVSPVGPRNPIVPQNAPAALRLSAI